MQDSPEPQPSFVLPGKKDGEPPTRVFMFCGYDGKQVVPFLEDLVCPVCRRKYDRKGQEIP